MSLFCPVSESKFRLASFDAQYPLFNGTKPLVKVDVQIRAIKPIAAIRTFHFAVLFDHFEAAAVTKIDLLLFDLQFLRVLFLFRGFCFCSHSTLLSKRQVSEGTDQTQLIGLRPNDELRPWPSPNPCGAAQHPRRGRIRASLSTTSCCARRL